MTRHPNYCEATNITCNQRHLLHQLILSTQGKHHYYPLHQHQREISTTATISNNAFQDHQHSTTHIQPFQDQQTTDTTHSHTFQDHHANTRTSSQYHINSINSHKDTVHSKYLFHHMFLS